MATKEYYRTALASVCTLTCPRALFAVACFFCAPAFAQTGQEKSAGHGAATSGVMTLQVIQPPDKGESNPDTHSSKNAKRIKELNLQLVSLRRELKDLKAKFTDLHPDVTAKKRHIEQVQKELRRLQRN